MEQEKGLPASFLTIIKAAKLPKSHKTQRKDHKQRSDVKRSPRFVAGLKRSITANPIIPMTTLAKNRGVYVSTISKAINNSLRMKSYVRRTRNLLTDKAKAIRAERCPKFEPPQNTKKMFVVDAEMNRDNSTVIAFEPSAVPPILKMKNPA
ncbi:Uncharacterized protein FKW44_002045, partial [Caligus rogercresseyi]